MTLAEVAMHASADDCYLVIRDRVYDVTKFADEHPGGKIILTYAGEDATGTAGACARGEEVRRLRAAHTQRGLHACTMLADVFAAFHTPTTHKMLEPFQVGELVQKDKDATAGAHHGRKLRANERRCCL